MSFRSEVRGACSLFIPASEDSTTKPQAVRDSRAPPQHEACTPRLTAWFRAGRTWASCQWMGKKRLKMVGASLGQSLSSSQSLFLFPPTPLSPLWKDNWHITNCTFLKDTVYIYLTVINVWCSILKILCTWAWDGYAHMCTHTQGIDY